MPVELTHRACPDRSRRLSPRACSPGTGSHAPSWGALCPAARGHGPQPARGWRRARRPSVSGGSLRRHRPPHAERKLWMMTEEISAYKDTGSVKRHCRGLLSTSLGRTLPLAAAFVLEFLAMTSFVGVCFQHWLTRWKRSAGFSDGLTPVPAALCRGCRGDKASCA